MRMHLARPLAALAVVALALFHEVASSAGDDSVPAAAPPASLPAAPAAPEAVARFLGTWAAAERAEVDAATGYPKEIRRAKDSMLMALVPAGTFQMGAVPGDAAATPAEKPRHAVTLTKAYYMDENEVTNAQFEKFVAATAYKTTAEAQGNGRVADRVGTWRDVAGASWKAPLPGGKRPSDWERHPVVLVTWDDAKAFSVWAGAALPTEAQFERAIRGGWEGMKYPWGNGLRPPERVANLADVSLKKAAPRWQWLIMEDYDDGFERTAPARSFPPNTYGLCDLSGNVWEWCSDWYDETYYASSPPQDPSGPSGPLLRRVMRGGSWMFIEDDLPSSRRGYGNPTVPYDYYGFRCARSLP